MKDTNFNISQIVPWLCAMIFVLSCAHQMAPSGGPDDKSPPAVAWTAPASGSVNVDKQARVVIAFSEWIAPATAEKSVSVLPPVDGGIRVAVSGKKLEIAPRKRFADSTTYHIVITSALQDLHSNPLASSVQFVFSTGASLDSGRIVGCVVDPASRNGKNFRPTVALFRDQGKATDTLLFRTPDYLVQADSTAFFSFGFIRVGQYRMVAFLDQNGDRKLAPGTEAAYAPVRPTVLVSRQADTVRLYPVGSDTVSPRLSSARAAAPDAVIGTWEPAPPDSLRGHSRFSWTLFRFDKPETGPAVTGVSSLGGNRSLIMLADSLCRAPYGLVCQYRKTMGVNTFVVSDTVRFNGIDKGDTVRPVLQQPFPGGLVSLSPRIRLVLSEPVSIVSPLFLADSLRDTVMLVSDSGFADTVVMRTNRRLHAGSKYRLTLLRTDMRDIAGNYLKPRDSTDTVAVMLFTTAHSDSIAVSLGGCASCLSADARRIWEFMPFAGVAVQCRDSAGCFRFDSIPAGGGFVGYFTDENNNGRADRGVLAPFMPPEPHDVFADTVEARARWEIDGLKIKACETCEKK
ncbi:MAG: Ig-like domain-containing protein [Chitinispirillaceae bacterium]|jgi:uncharacterized protein (DUF2141 family)|nr:Ig-like domain-containing protein [Chitinispirillaceae bacterium]